MLPVNLHRALSFATYHAALMLLLQFMTAGAFFYDSLEHDLTHQWFTVLLVMRVYALYFRNKWVLCLVALEVAAGTVVASVRASSMTTTLAFHSW